MNSDQTTTTATVSLKQVTLEQGGKPIYGPLTWEILPGEQWAILGPMGSGKRPLAKAIAGQTPVTGGEIRYSLERSGFTSERSPHDQIGYVTFNHRPRGDASFHQARWHADLSTASPKVAEALSISGVWHDNPFEVTRDRPQPQILERFQKHRADIISQLELGRLLERRLHQLSDGEWRRLQIARALLRAPRLLILDHPLVGLDKDFRPKLDRTLAELTRQTGCQILLLCAHRTEVMALITHVLVMDSGRIVARGSKDTLIAPEKTQDAQAHPLPPAQWVAPHNTSPALIRMDKINIVHNGTQVLQNITWHVHQGEKWALVGPNGAGKSTLLSLVLGDHPQAYANDIELFGRPRGSGESIWEIKRRIGWVSPELHRYHPPEATALDIVCSGYFDSLGLHKTTSATQRDRGHDLMRRFGMADCHAQPFYQLSKDQQRLTLIARALIKDPELLVLDEPCQGLDTTHLQIVLAALEEVTSDPMRTLIYVTHHTHEFPRGLTHILEIARGKPIRQGPLSPADTAD